MADQSDHRDRALRMLENSKSLSLEEQAVAVAAAQVHATLALADAVRYH